MTTFALVVTSPPLDSQLPYSALQFAKAAIDAGHHISGVFFYQAGVHCASAYTLPHSDEVNLVEQWQTLHQSAQVPLYVCITAANRRGLANETDAAEQGFAGFNVAESFIIAGLGELAQLCADSDRVVQF